MRRRLLGLSDEQEGEWLATPPDRKAVVLIIGGAVFLLIAMFLPHVSFDASFPGQVTLIGVGEIPSFTAPPPPVYPHGESFSYMDFSDGVAGVLTVLIPVALCVVFALRFNSRRTAWPYRLLWVCVILSSLDSLAALMVLIPGYSGYYLFLENAHGADAAFQIFQYWERSSGARDAWASVTNVSYWVLLLFVAASWFLLRGTWYARSIRRADKAALAKHQREVIDRASRKD